MSSRRTWRRRGGEPPGESLRWSACPAISWQQAAEVLAARGLPAPPEEDGWGHPLDLCLDVDLGGSQALLGVRSRGRDGEADGDVYRVAPFAPTEPDHDVVWIDGFFVTWPEAEPAPTAQRSAG